MAFLAIASLTAPVGVADKQFPCVPNAFPQEGYILVGVDEPSEELAGRLDRALASVEGGQVKTIA